MLRGEAVEQQVQVNSRGENERFRILVGYSEWRVRPADAAGEFCVMETMLPPNGGVPMHRHEEQEVFYLLEGEMEIGKPTADGVDWALAKSGDCIHVPANAWHTFRNMGSKPTRMLTLAMGELGQFFQEVGTPVGTDTPPTPEAIARVREISKKYRQEFYKGR